jgi:acyl dehydratase
MKKPSDLKNLLLPAILTIFRSKRVGISGYSDNEKYCLDSIQCKKLEDYKAFFSFNTSIPLSYFYLISQSVQLQLMTKKSFPLPIPGMIHLESKITQYADVDESEALTIESKIDIKNKETGSLTPVFIESYYQNKIKVVEIESLYLVKRRSKKKTRNRKENPITDNDDPNWLAASWKISKKDSSHYAKISGDFNPIHIITPIAWLFGFKGRIIHGWYCASKAVAKIESETEMPVKSIHVNFLRPLRIATKAKFEFRLSSDRNFQFRIKRDQEEHFAVSGYIS